MERQKRKADIEKGLQFIHIRSWGEPGCEHLLPALPLSTLPLKQEEYEAFLLKLVQNLFAEGNDLFREKDHKQALVQYMEGLNVADYAASDQVALPRELLCKLHVNRAACYFTMGLYEKSLEDSEKALGLDSENIRALFRKARALNELGRHKEAYECSSRCSLALPHDESVTQLGQELAQKLGLRVRKAYKRPQELETFSPLSNGMATGMADQGTSNGLGSIDDIETDCYMDLRGSPAPLPSSPTMPLFPHVLDLLAPLDSGSRALPSTESLDDFSDGDIFGPELDTLLDSLRRPTHRTIIPQVVLRNQPPRQSPPCPTLPCSSRTPWLPPMSSSRPASSAIPRQAPGQETTPTVRALSTSASGTSYLAGSGVLRTRPGNASGRGPPRPALWAPTTCAKEEIDVWTEERKGTLNRDLLFDPLGGVKRGSLTIAKLLKEHQGIFTFLCERLMGLGVTADSSMQFQSTCLLLYPFWPSPICFDSKPRIISKGTKDSPSVCSNLAAKHSFYNNKCLVHIVRSTSLKYSKIRQFQEHFQFDVCRHEVRYGCLREDSCHFAHSFIELKVWLLQQYSGMTHEDIVQESKKYWQQMEAHAGKASSSLGAPRTHGPSTFDLQMKFVCGQCWRNGQVVEPDKDLKYCSAKARHCWTKERRVLLVMSKAKRKWVSVRPLPSIRNFPQQYDLCIHAQNGRKCQYVGNCSFAHSPEERDMWTFMKENKILDMQQTYDMWLKKHNPGKPGEGTPISSREGEKQIQMPTDYADIMMGYHCWLCGKNSNSKKQWQQHIQSEKHKEKVFTSDSDASSWAYRFPMGEFRLCDRLQKGKACPDGDKCRCAHGQEELNEWLDRREVLKQKLAKARKDMLLCPRDDDFGKYNFLLQEGGDAATPEAPAAAATTTTGE
ncbi:zinc finger CCCH domain-containing protein 7B isoform 7-T7 [Dugong dugon]